MDTFDPASRSEAAAASAEAAYAVMLRLRRFEEKAGLLYALGKLGRPCPLGVGQEAALAALVSVLRPSDVCIALRATPGLRLALGETCLTAFRDLVDERGASDAREALLRRPLQPLLTNASIDDVRTGLAETARGEGPSMTAVVLDPAGDAARDIAALNASLAAAVRPVLALLIVPRDARPPAPDLSPDWSLRAIDGADFAAVRAALTAAREDLLAGPDAAATGRLLMTILTPPYAGHARSAEPRAAGSRPPATAQEVTDPLKLLRAWLRAAGGRSEAACTALETRIRDEVAAAARALDEEEVA